MKLNKYIYKEVIKVWFGEGQEKEAQALLTEEDVEDWICEWYMSTFKEINCGSDGKPRLPPTWLAGPRWYDRRRRMMKEAQEEEDAKETQV